VIKDKQLKKMQQRLKKEWIKQIDL